VDGVAFRPAATADAGAIAALVTQLGYPTSPAEMEQRLHRLLVRPEYISVVAAFSGEIAGLAAAYVGHALEFDSPYGQLIGLVVDERWRGRGIGRLLMERMEDALRDRGATMLILTSGSRREDAHKFYEHIGYRPTGVRFAKRL
jgi:GNAT superfamily N-acetyltransferase